MCARAPAIGRACAAARRQRGRREVSPTPSAFDRRDFWLWSCVGVVACLAVVATGNWLEACLCLVGRASFFCRVVCVCILPLLLCALVSPM